MLPDPDIWRAAAILIHRHGARTQHWWPRTVPMSSRPRVMRTARRFGRRLLRPSWSCGEGASSVIHSLNRKVARSIPQAFKVRWLHLLLPHTQVYDHPIVGMSLDGRRRLRDTCAPEREVTRAPA
jgi:hypothetical protein